MLSVYSSIHQVFSSVQSLPFSVYSTVLYCTVYNLSILFAVSYTLYEHIISSLPATQCTHQIWICGVAHCAMQCSSSSEASSITKQPRSIFLPLSWSPATDQPATTLPRFMKRIAGSDSKSSIRRFVITEKAPTRAFSVITLRTFGWNFLKH